MNTHWMSAQFLCDPIFFGIVTDRFASDSLRFRRAESNFRYTRYTDDVRVDVNAFQSILRKNDSARPGPRGNTSLWQQQSISQPARCQYMNMTASLTEYPIHPLSFLFFSPALTRLSYHLPSPLPRPSDRNVKRNHYSPYDIANIVNSPPALCGLSMTLSIHALTSAMPPLVSKTWHYVIA